ncbi:maltose alpha-D-glucosyltransferase/ alpha-amylase [Chitinophaga terrae (ex Kim and Jung 2007)]|uniref:Maltose alpha-D-glucosyltransferase/ alpha-amylase n=1 Tax=Chitinophaga terrae (ex Kim and Jung 2007) TaxID=408074 RepID=A0A1H4AW49_9BACT|nr:alpha-amylase family protein [Chitinophaga terrae (ex Kim and Jung 2007)]GEP89109.1 trehalose synthase [Chitinophaga terrae (ex Kim and Jung 2007)]SEA40087.1 maltose alpha-D-glucosyltransferase/ alpha-amylase [Chitinophaga terrae (ex Kim and Jung 2007)]
MFKKELINTGYLLWIIYCLYSCRQSAPFNNTTPAWYKNEFIYNLDVKTFKDSDGNGTGDFKGLTEQLDYLRSLGVTTLWLAPFQPSPRQDDGYDVSDYYGIDPEVGDSTSFREFLEAAHRRQMRVIMDVVLNHSSIEHPWFRQSRDSSSPKHNWYLWSARRPKDWDKGSGFPGVENETWTRDSVTGQYFFHRFYHFEPDLNFQNPEVVAASRQILGYWLEKGVDGFRLDAVPFIIADPRKSAAHPEHDFDILHQLVRSVKDRHPSAVLLGEANVTPAENEDYFSEAKDGLDMMFNFYVNQYLFYAVASGNTKFLAEALDKTTRKPAVAQWAYFLRNHDEVDLGRLSRRQLQETYKELGPDTSMQLYGRGIRRRLAPMLGNNKQRLQMLYSLLFALPGTPVIRYGEEIGMGDTLVLKERLAIRTPMQWNNRKNGGFSIADSCIRPVISTGVYSYYNVNVATQLQDSASLLNHIRRMVSLRKRFPMIGAGYWEIVNTHSPQTLTLRYTDKKSTLITCFNFSDKPVQLRLDLPRETKLTNLYTGRKNVAGNQALALEPYGWRWYLLN